MSEEWREFFLNKHFRVMSEEALEKEVRYWERERDRYRNYDAWIMLELIEQARRERDE